MESGLILTGNTFKKVEETFFDYLDINELTYKAYKFGIDSFINYLKENGIEHPTRIDFKNYRDHIKTTNKANTVNSYMTAVRALFKYLETNELYPNITKDVKSLKTSKVPRTQTLNQEQCKDIYSSLVDLREKCLFSLAVSTGLRANEIATAKIENIKVYNNQIVLFVKCKKRDDESEYVKLSDHVYQDIINYIGSRTQGNIFVSTSHNNTGGGVTSTSIRNIIKSIFKRHGIDQDWFSCHSLRKTMATISYSNGANIVDIQQVLHHSSIATTRRYISQITRDSNNTEQRVSDLLFN